LEDRGGGIIGGILARPINDTAIEKGKLEIIELPPAAEREHRYFRSGEKISACQPVEVLVQLKNERVIINDFGTPLEIAINQLGWGAVARWREIEERWCHHNDALSNGR
jgi:hypothetical protein